MPGRRKIENRKSTKTEPDRSCDVDIVVVRSPMAQRARHLSDRRSINRSFVQSNHANKPAHNYFLKESSEAGYRARPICNYDLEPSTSVFCYEVYRSASIVPASALSQENQRDRKSTRLNSSH